MTILKNLVDDYEEAIDKGKLAVASRDVELILVFIDSSRDLLARSKPIITSTREVMHNITSENDKLAKYISVYYRMLVYISIPYIADIVRAAADILEKQGYSNEAGEARNLFKEYSSLLDTLK